MNTTITLRDELITLLPTVSELGLTSAQVSKHKRDVVETYPQASVYIDAIGSERISRDCLTRQPGLSIQLFYTHATDIQEKLVNLADALEQAIFDATLSADCFVDNVRFAYSPDSIRQGSVTLSITAFYSSNLDP